MTVDFTFKKSVSNYLFHDTNTVSLKCRATDKTHKTAN